MKNSFLEGLSETGRAFYEIEKARSASDIEGIEIEAFDYSWSVFPSAFSQFVFGTSTAEKFADVLHLICGFTKLRFGEDCFSRVAGFRAAAFPNPRLEGGGFDASSDYVTANCIQWTISIFRRMEKGLTAVEAVNDAMQGLNIKTLLSNLSEADQEQISNNVIQAIGVIQRGEAAPTCFRCARTLDVASFKNASCHACFDREERARVAAGLTLADQLEDARFASQKVLQIYGKFADVAITPSNHADSPDDVFREFNSAVKECEKAMTAPVADQIFNTNLDRTGMCGAMTMEIVEESKSIVDHVMIELRKGENDRLLKFPFAFDGGNKQRIDEEFDAALKALKQSEQRQAENAPAAPIDRDDQGDSVAPDNGEQELDDSRHQSPSDAKSEQASGGKPQTPIFLGTIPRNNVFVKFIELLAKNEPLKRGMMICIARSVTKESLGECPKATNLVSNYRSYVAKGKVRKMETAN